MGSGTSINESASISRVLQDRKNGCDAGLFPGHFTETIRMRDAEMVFVEEAQDPVG